MMDEFEFYDISPEISEKLAVWPGDTRFQREVLANFDRNGNYLLSTLRATLHLGAHADAPCHYTPNGESIDERNLSFYYGKCQVIHLEKPSGSRILPEDLEGKKIQTPRLLFKTGSFPDPNHWNTDFCSLSPSLIETLSRLNVVLVGIDTPSVDPFQDKALEAHQTIAKANMAILEGIVLDHVPEGVYTLAAFPLRLKDADASPVRAVLIQPRRASYV